MICLQQRHGFKHIPPSRQRYILTVQDSRLVNEIHSTLARVKSPRQAHSNASLCVMGVFPLQCDRIQYLLFNTRGRQVR